MSERRCRKVYVLLKGDPATATRLCDKCGEPCIQHVPSFAPEALHGLAMILAERVFETLMQEAAAEEALKSGADE